MRFHHGHQADFEEAGMMLARYALPKTSKLSSTSLHRWRIACQIWTANNKQVHQQFAPSLE